MVGRGELTDEAWGRVAPLLPESGQPLGADAVIAGW